MKVRRWRERNQLTQIDAARLLGVSQPYLSLVENGARPLNRELRDRLHVVRQDEGKPESSDDRLAAQISALGYPGFAHMHPARPAAEPSVVLLNALSQANLDARITEALPWLGREYAGRLDWPWLVQHAKLRNLQNRLGFLIEIATDSRSRGPAIKDALHELDKARLLVEATLCWDSMPAATRKWIRAHRSAVAKHWNIVTLMRSEDAGAASQTS